MEILEFITNALTLIAYFVRIVFGHFKESFAIVERGNRPLQRVSMILSFFLFWLELSLLDVYFLGKDVLFYYVFLTFSIILIGVNYA